MRIKETEFAEMESKVKDYYRNINLIKAKEKQIEFYKNRLQRIDEDIIRLNNNLSLNPDIHGIAYDGIKVSGGISSSSMERQIDNIYDKLENEKNRLNEIICTTRYDIRRIEEKNDSLREIMLLLSDDNRKILELRYIKNYSYERIAEEVLISKSNVVRRINQMIEELWLFCNICNVEFLQYN